MWFASLLISQSAWAAPLNQKFCFYFDTALNDTLAATGDDYMTNDSLYKARGVRYRVENNNTGAVLTGFADDGGCKTLTLESTHTYAVELQSWASFGEFTAIRVHPSRAQHNTLFAYDLIQKFSPPGGTFNVVANASFLGLEWVNVMAVWTNSVYRGGAHIPPYTYNAYLEAPSGGGGAAVEYPVVGGNFRPGMSLALASDAKNFKTVLAHELGHLVDLYNNCARDGVCGQAQAPNGGSYSAALGSCGPAFGVAGHGINTTEFQTAAEIEGFAHYFSAFSFNNVAQGECRLDVGEVDWNHTNNPLTFVGGGFSCEGQSDGDAGGVEWTEPSVPVNGRDYFNQFCDDVPAVNDNRGTDVDWLRFWWDVHHGAGLTLEDVLEVRQHAFTNTWTHLDTAPNANKAWPRIVAAFTAAGRGPVYTTAKTNGIAE